MSSRDDDEEEDEDRDEDKDEAEELPDHQKLVKRIKKFHRSK